MNKFEKLAGAFIDIQPKEWSRDDLIIWFDRLNNLFHERACYLEGGGLDGSLYRDFFKEADNLSQTFMGFSGPEAKERPITKPEVNVEAMVNYEYVTEMLKECFKVVQKLGKLALDKEDAYETRRAGYYLAGMATMIKHLGNDRAGIINPKFNEPMT